MNGKIGSQHALIAYFLIALGFTWSIHFSINLLGYAFVMDLSSPAMMLYLIGLLGPLVAGIIVSALLNGGAGVRALLAQGLKWRFPLRWYLVAIFALPLILESSSYIWLARSSPALWASIAGDGDVTLRMNLDYDQIESIGCI